MEQQKKKSVSIRLKLISIVIPIVLILIISFFALARNMVMKTSQEKLQAKSEVYTEVINGWVGQIFGELQVYQDTIEEGNFKDDDAILRYMETTVNKNEAYSVGLYMGDDSGIYLDGSGWEPGSDWVLTERDWYMDGRDNDTFAFGEPYYDSMTGQVCVSASVRVDYSKAERVLATDVYLDYVSNLITDISNQEQENAFLVTKESQTIIAHVDSEMMAVTLRNDGMDSLYTEIGKALEEEKSGFLSVNGDDGKYYVCLNPVEHTDWYLVTYVQEKTVLADLYRMEFIMILVAVVAALVLILVISGMMNRVIKPVRAMTDVIDCVAEGDFSQDIESRGNDEIGRMSNNMQSFILQMRGTISEISDIAGWLEHQAMTNGEVSSSLKDAAHMQEEEMDRLEQMVEQLSDSAQQAKQQMEHLTALIEQADEEGKAAEILMQESVEMSQNGKEGMESVHNGMLHINTSITTLSEQMENVRETVSQIENMVHMIADIAAETNLLSLNASIEAARAGEAGRGFSVVAEEIGKLAADSSLAAEQISKLTLDIQGTVNEAVEHMHTSVAHVQTNVGVASEAKNTFESLYGKVDETSHRVQQMIELVDEVDAVSKEMEQLAIGQVEAAEQIAGSAEGLNQQTQNVTASSCEVAESAVALEQESEKLMKRMGEFRI